MDVTPEMAAKSQFVIQETRLTGDESDHLLGPASPRRILVIGPGSRTTVFISSDADSRDLEFLQRALETKLFLLRNDAEALANGIGSPDAAHLKLDIEAVEQQLRILLDDGGSTHSIAERLNMFCLSTRNQPRHSRTDTLGPRIVCSVDGDAGSILSRLYFLDGQTFLVD
jgi:hypothetical protein